MADFAGTIFDPSLTFRVGSEDPHAATFFIYAPPSGDITPPVFAGVDHLDTPTLTSLVAHWNAATDDVTPTAAIVYEIDFDTSSGAITGSNFQPIFVTAPGALSFKIPGLSPSTTYYVLVRARDQAFNVDSNNVVASLTTAPGGPPVISNIVPPPSSGPIGKNTALSFDLTDPSGLFRDVIVLASFPGTNVDEVVWDGSVFAPFYNAQSSVSGIVDGMHFSLLRAGGWIASPTISVHAIDPSGQENAP